jgi:hypothetical protein
MKNLKFEFFDLLGCRAATVGPLLLRNISEDQKRQLHRGERLKFLDEVAI